MYILFRLPEDNDRITIGHVNQLLNQELHRWSDQHNVPYTKKFVKNTVRITFDDDRHYTLFAVTWDPQGRHRNWLHYEFIEPMNIDRSR